MTLLGRLLGHRWQCTTCGKRYRRNPSKCGKCSGTVFTQVRENERQPTGR